MTEAIEAPHNSRVGQESLLAIKDLHTYFFTQSGEVRAVNGLTLDVAQHEIVGLVGETGSGKSMTAASIMRIVRPPGSIVQGEVRFAGRDLTLLSEKEMRHVRGKQIGFIVQNAKASLNPLIPVGAHILNVYRAHLSLSRKEAERHLLEVLQSVGFKDARRIAASYPHQLSGGMAQRVVIATAIGTSPSLIIADEPTTGLDATVQVQVLDVMMQRIEDAQASALLITHDLRIVANYCDRVAVMYAGRVVENAPVVEFFHRPMHPYSIQLLDALAHPVSAKTRAAGDVPRGVVTAAPKGCPYHTRCPIATDRCMDTAPALREVRPDHWVECHYAEISTGADQ